MLALSLNTLRDSVPVAAYRWIVVVLVGVVSGCDGKPAAPDWLEAVLSDTNRLTKPDGDTWREIVIEASNDSGHSVMLLETVDQASPLQRLRVAWLLRDLVYLAVSKEGTPRPPLEYIEVAQRLERTATAEVRQVLTGMYQHFPWENSLPVLLDRAGDINEPVRTRELAIRAIALSWRTWRETTRWPHAVGELRTIALGTEDRRIAIVTLRSLAALEAPRAELRTLVSDLERRGLVDPDDQLLHDVFGSEPIPVNDRGG